jgi:cobalt-zinc-cadmium efflux system outer membrane protein
MIMKQMNFGLPLLTAVLVGVMSPPAKSQETNATPVITSLSLDALVTEAVEKNPELKFYEAEIAAVKAGRKSAGVWANPEVSGDVGQKRVSGNGVSDEGLAWSVSVLQPFEWPGRLGLRKAIANRDLELAELGYARFKIALATKARLLAYDLFAAQEKATAAGEVAERFKALREVLVQRDPAGLTPLLETRVIEATELNAQRKASEALLVAQSALLELNQLRGVSADTRLSVRSGQLSFRPPEERQTLLAIAQTNNFELRLRTIELEQQGLRVDLAKNERYPSLAVGPTFSEEKVAGTREQTISIGAALPLPLWDRNTGNVSAAKARQTQAEVSRHLAEREMQRQVLSAAWTYETKLREMAKWRPDSVQHFKEAAALADRHYRLGAVPISTYVELQQQYLEAVESLLDTKREALAAAAQLEMLTGLTQPFTSVGAAEEKK